MKRDVCIVLVLSDEWRAADVRRAQADAVLRAGEGFDVVLAFDGLDDDSREVWEVPEVIQFCRNFATDRKSLLALMESCEADPEIHGAGLGQLEVTACHGGTVVVDGSAFRLRYSRAPCGELAIVAEEIVQGEA